MAAVCERELVKRRITIDYDKILEVGLVTPPVLIKSKTLLSLHGLAPSMLYSVFIVVMVTPVAAPA